MYRSLICLLDMHHEIFLLIILLLYPPVYLPGYKGLTCSDDINECEDMQMKVCNNGNCTNTPGSYKCVCGDAFLGTACEISNDCLNWTCSNQGLCLYNKTQGNNYHFFCQCTNGHEGLNCEKVSSQVSLIIEKLPVNS